MAPPVKTIPVTTLAAVGLVLVKFETVFCDTAWLGVVAATFSPITDDKAPVPVPVLEVRFRTVFDVHVAAAFVACMPMTCEEMSVPLRVMESATVPPIRFEVAVQSTVLAEFDRSP